MTDTDRMLPCPVCMQIMTLDCMGNVEIDVCELHGIWLDLAELLRVTEHERESAQELNWEDLFRKRASPEVDHSRALTCPVSGTTMKVERFHGVHMDWSPGHGVWLDNGELDAVMNNLRLDAKYMRGIALRLGDAKY